MAKNARDNDYHSSNRSGAGLILSDLDFWYSSVNHVYIPVYISLSVSCSTRCVNRVSNNICVSHVVFVCSKCLCATSWPGPA